MKKHFYYPYSDKKSTVCPVLKKLPSVFLLILKKSTL